jgi:hypothetical protein
VPGGITGPPCYWGDINTETWSFRLGVGRKADGLSLKKKVTVGKPREVKIGWSNSRKFWQSLLRKAMAQKGLFCQS